MIPDSIRKGAVEAQAFLKEAHELLPPDAVKIISKASLTEMGQYHWSHTYKDVPPGELVDYESIDNYFTWVNGLEPLQRYYQHQVSQIPDQKISIMFSSRWVDSGLPVFRLGHKKTAALMATTISKDSLKYIQPPWPAFFIEVPPGIIEIKDGGRSAPIKGVVVHAVNHPPGKSDIMSGLGWTWMAITDTTLVQWHLNATPEILVGKEESADYWHGIGLDYDDYDKRVGVLIGRLIAALCLMQSDPTQFKERREIYKDKGYQGKRKKTSQDAPNYRVFVDADPIEVDVREAVHAYLRGERRSSIPSVRTQVIGHLKLQPHGPHNSLRKVIWRKPYWTRGIEGAPIAKRTIDLK